MKKDKKYHIPCVIEGGLFSGLWGCLAGVIAGIVKEWCDHIYTGSWDKRDFGFTCLGVAVAMAIVLITHLLV